jgi:hypothetical protein
MIRKSVYPGVKQQQNHCVTPSQYHEHPQGGCMVSATSHGIEAFNAIHHAMKKRCLAMPNVARRCRTKSQKSPQ